MTSLPPRFDGQYGDESYFELCDLALRALRLRHADEDRPDELRYAALHDVHASDDSDHAADEDRLDELSGAFGRDPRELLRVLRPRRLF